jgi:pSer/pThr/pTyr-binding forkhead associated (FHA) protein
MKEDEKPMAKDYIDSIRDGLGIVGRMAAKGVGKLSDQLKGDEKDETPGYKTGLYFQKHLSLRFGDLSPRLEYHESVEMSNLGGGFLKKFKRTQADRAFVSACYGLLLGEDEVALAKLSDVLASEPQYTDAYYMKGILYLHRGNYERAEENFSKCRLLPIGLGTRLMKFVPSLKSSILFTDNLTFSFYPDVVGLNLLLAISQRNAGKLSLAIQTLEQILSVMPDNAELLLFLAMFYYEARWDDKMIERFKDIVPDNNIGVIIAQFLVMVWINRKNYSLAEGVLQKALESVEVDPYLHADVRVLLGDVAMKSGRSGESASYISRVKKKFIDYMNITTRMGLQRNSNPVSAEEQAPPPLPPVFEEQLQKMEKSGAEETGKEMPETWKADKEERDSGSDSQKTSIEKKLSEGTKEIEEPPEFEGKIKLVSADGKVRTEIQDQLVIGREEGDVVIHWDVAASRKHARVYREKGQVLVEDLDSTNGTWINRHRVKNHRTFNRGDVLLVGNTEFHLEQE